MDILDTAGAMDPGTAENAPDGADTGDRGQSTPRDYAAEARQHGWTEKEAFKGDPGKWVDAETFVKRADEVMPFLKKQNTALKREMDELKRTVKQASAHFDKVEERAYQRAMTELQAKHDEAVETGDVAAARAAVKEIGELTAEAAAKPKAEPVAAPDDKETARKFAAWVENSDFYGVDDQKTAYADLQARAMGPAPEWEGGPDEYLAEIERRVQRKFAAKPVNPTNGGGNRPAPGGGGKTYNDLPAAAKAACDKWVKSGLIKSREDYVKTYQFD